MPNPIVWRQQDYHPWELHHLEFSHVGARKIKVKLWPVNKHFKANRGKKPWLPSQNQSPRGTPHPHSVLSTTAHQYLWDIVFSFVKVTWSLLTLMHSSKALTSTVPVVQSGFNNTKQNNSVWVHTPYWWLVVRTATCELVEGESYPLCITEHFVKELLVSALFSYHFILQRSSETNQPKVTET